MPRHPFGLLLIASLLTLGACSRAAADDAVAAEGRAFLAQNGKAPGVVTTASGLEYKVLVAGRAAGPHPGADDAVKVNYEVKLLNGQVIDSSFQRGQPDVMRLGGLIGAWKEALRLMRPGDTWEIWSPPALAYGNDDTGPIPGGSVLAFKIELIATAR